MVYLEHGKPMVFGKNRDKGIRLNGLEPEVVTLGNGVTEKDLLVHDESAASPTLAALLTPDGLSGDAGVFGRAALRGAADVRRPAASAARKGGQGKGPGQAGRTVRQRRHVGSRSAK